MLNLIDQLKDPYERKARVTPGLLVALPILLPLVCVYGPKHPMLMSVVGLLTACGAIYALANIARGRGKQLEEKLISTWGGLPSTVLLRHRDKFFDSVTKARYHAAITAKLGILMPTPEEEAANPEKADDSYEGAARRLRELTRSDKQLLLKENIAYGFHRNMLAMKPIGLFTSIGGLLYGLLISRVVVLQPLRLAAENLSDPGLAGGITLLISMLLLFAWCFYFNADKVHRIGIAYAERLFEHLPLLPASTQKRRSSSTAKSS